MDKNVKFIDTDPIIYEQKLIQTYETLTNRTLQPADPERLLINLMTYAITLCSINIDQTGRMNLLATAQGTYLDKLGELVGCTRLPAQKSKTTIRFSIDEPKTFDIVIPAGTRVAANDDIIFETAREAAIKAGQTFVDVEAQSTSPGKSYNGFSIGQINKLLDPIPYITQVANITMTMYGSDEEDDDRYRERIRLSLEKFSTAGSKYAYIYHTQSVHPDISDVEVYSTAPGEVRVVFLLKNGNIPNQDMINLVATYLSNEKVRPLTDKVIVEVPSVINYQIKITYYLEKSSEPLQQQINKLVNQKIQEFINWTQNKLGRDILPEKLTELIMSIEGIHSIDITAPTKQLLNINQVAICNAITINYGGVRT